MKTANKLINRIIKQFSITRLKTSSKVVYLTFDDGPEPNITEFILNELKKYNFKATFFCKGENISNYPYLLKYLIEEKQGLGNHTYSHINSFTTNTDEYINDIEKCDKQIHSHLFRPPWGSIRFKAWLKLKKKYKFIFWNITSGDTDLYNFDLVEKFTKLKSNTKKGDIVLFHFCNRHEKETMQILPLYIEWLYQNNYKAELIK